MRADVGHPGRNNQFLIARGHKLAMLYNDISVLENFHAARLFELCDDAEGDILALFSPSKYGEFRRMIVDFIMATDLGMQRRLVDELENTFAPGGASACSAGARGARRV